MFSILFALFIFILILNSTNFIFDILQNTNRNLTFVQMRKLEIKFSMYEPIYKLYIPYFIMVGLDIKVILSLRQSKKRVLNGRGVRNGMNKFTISTIIIDFILLIFKSPQTIFQLYSYVIIIREGFSRIINVSFLFDLSSRLIDDIAFSYSAFIVFIFVIFNRLFRKEIICFFRLDRLSVFSISLMNSTTRQNWVCWVGCHFIIYR